MNQTELPPTDHVARVLLKQGARDAALNLLRAAVARDPGEMACAALLKAVEARPDASVYGPDVRLNVSVARTYARRGWLLEALALLDGAGLTRTASGRELSLELQEILGPIPDDSPADLEEADRELRRGGASLALMTFDQYSATGRQLPAWAERRHQLLSTLLLDAAPMARPSAEIRAMSPVGSALGDHLAARDLKGALAAAKEYLSDHPDDRDAQLVVVALGRVIEAMAGISREVDVQSMSTQPMTGVNVALFQTRMCNFDLAERMFRKMVISDPMDELARAYLDDVQTIKRALGAVVSPSMEPPSRPTVDPLRSTGKAHTGDVVMPEAMDPRPTASRRVPQAGPPPRPAPEPVSAHPILEEPTRRIDTSELLDRVEQTRSPVTSNELPRDLPEELTREVDLRIPGEAKKPVTSPNLLKKSSRPDAAGWGGAGEAAKASDWDEVSTEIGDPDEMAELMLKQGYAERALRIYERLARVYPNRERYGRRVAEIAELIEAGAVPALKTHPGADITSRPDEPASSLDVTQDEVPIEADPRAPAIGAALDALAPPMGDMPLGPELGLEMPPTADHSATSARAEAAEPEPDWTEEETTMVHEAPEMDDFADQEGVPTSVKLMQPEATEIAAQSDAGARGQEPRETPADGDVVVRRVIAVR